MSMSESVIRVAYNRPVWAHDIPGFSDGGQLLVQDAGDLAKKTTASIVVIN